MSLDVPIGVGGVFGSTRQMSRRSFSGLQCNVSVPSSVVSACESELGKRVAGVVREPVVTGAPLSRDMRRIDLKQMLVALRVWIEMRHEREPFEGKSDKVCFFILYVPHVGVGCLSVCVDCSFCAT